MSQESPGSFDKSPTAASTNAISATTAPIPRIPTIAPGTSAAVALRASIIADNRPIPAIPFSKAPVSIPLNASTTPVKNAIRTSIPALISDGRLLAISSKIPIRNLKARSTI